MKIIHHNSQISELNILEHLEKICLEILLHITYLLSMSTFLPFYFSKLPTSPVNYFQFIFLELKSARAHLTTVNSSNRHISPFSFCQYYIKKKPIYSKSPVRMMFTSPSMCNLQMPQLSGAKCTCYVVFPLLILHNTMQCPHHRESDRHKSNFKNVSHLLPSTKVSSVT